MRALPVVVVHQIFTNVFPCVGDSALDWTMDLTEIAESVDLIHRRNEYRGAASALGVGLEPEFEFKIDAVADEVRVLVIVARSDPPLQTQDVGAAGQDRRFPVG